MSEQMTIYKSKLGEVIRQLRMSFVEHKITHIFLMGKSINGVRFGYNKYKILFLVLNHYINDARCVLFS